MPDEKNMSDDKQNPTRNVYYVGCARCLDRKKCKRLCPLAILNLINRRRIAILRRRIKNGK